MDKADDIKCRYVPFNEIIGSLLYCNRTLLNGDLKHKLELHTVHALQMEQAGCQATYLCSDQRGGSNGEINIKWKLARLTAARHYSRVWRRLTSTSEPALGWRIVTDRVPEIRTK